LRSADYDSSWRCRTTNWMHSHHLL